MKRQMYRQGDILLIESTMEMGEKPENSDILIEGSLTGHHHRIVNGIIWKQEIDSNGVFAYVLAEDNCKLVHNEHKTIKLPPGLYEVRRQREVSGYVSD